jgi:hypothetical protein
MPQPTGLEMLVSLLPMIILTTPLAFGVLYIAPKVGANRWLWFVICLVPIVNFFALYVFMFLVLGRMLDRINLIGDRVTNVAPFS